MTGLFIALVVFTLAGGYGPWSERYLRGLAIAGGAMFLGGLLRVPLMLVLTIVVLAGIVRMRRAARFEKFRWVDLLIALPVFLTFFVSLRFPLSDFDGRGFWLLKAKAIAHEQTITGPFFRGEAAFDPRNHYPLLIPLDAGMVLRLTGTLDDKQVRGVYALTFLALLLVVRRRASPWLAALIAWTPQFLVNVEGGAYTAYNDVPLAAFAACAIFDLVEGAPPLRLGIWLAALTLTKSEGLLYAAVLLAIAAFVHRKRVWPAALLYLTAAGALTWWRALVPHTDDEDFFARLPLLSRNLGRVLPAIGGFARHMLDVQNWGLFWIAVVAIVFVRLARSETRPGIMIPLVVMCAMLGVYVAVYVVTAWNLDELIARSANRLLMHLDGPAVLLLNTFSASARSR